MSTTEGALRLWREIVSGLRAAGYDRVVPEYLKLSQALAQLRMTELLKGLPEAEHWAEIRRLAIEALQSLGPLAEAARILAELPTELRTGAAAKAEASPQPSRLGPPASRVAVQSSGHPSRASRNSGKSLKRSGVSAATRVAPSSHSGRTKKSKQVSKSTLSGNPQKNVKRAKRRDHGN